MATTTVREFVDALEAITITGILRQYTQGPPTQTNDPDIPCTFVMAPRIGDRGWVFQNQGGWPELIATHVILVQAAAQNLQPVNFDKSVDFMDAMNTALRALSCGTLGKAHIQWTQRMGTIQEVSGVEYWAVLTEVTGRG